MKRTVKVTIEKEFDIEIPDHLLTDQHIAEFESCMWELDGDGTKVEQLFQYAGRGAAYDWDHLEGMGYMGSKYLRDVQKEDRKKDFIVIYEHYEDCEAEVVK